MTKNNSTALRCEACDEEMVKINLLIDGESLIMASCSNCDTRSWHRGADPVELNGVLHDLSATRTRYRRDLANR